MAWVVDTSVVLDLVAGDPQFEPASTLNGPSLLIFPELINLKRPLNEEKPVKEATAFTVTGAVENVFASLVVLRG